MNKSKIPKIDILQALLRAWLESYAVPLFTERLIGRQLPGRAEFRLHTRIGELRINVNEDWYACAFIDTEKAKSYFGITGIGQGRLNPHSGKWNWYPWDVCPSGFKPRGGDAVSRYSRAVLFELADEFCRELKPLLPDVPKDKSCDATTTTVTSDLGCS